MKGERSDANDYYQKVKGKGRCASNFHLKSEVIASLSVLKWPTRYSSKAVSNRIEEVKPIPLFQSISAFSSLFILTALL